MFQKRDCVKNWNMTLTMYGYCLQLIPSSTVYSESKFCTCLFFISIFIQSVRGQHWRWWTNRIIVNCLCLQQIRLGVDWLGELFRRVIFYKTVNYSSESNFRFTLYYTAVDDEALEPAKSILLTDVTRGVPIVSLRQKRTELLGVPYSQCRRSGSSLLHYKAYTKNQ